jgi:hypothetical protein
MVSVTKRLTLRIEVDECEPLPRTQMMSAFHTAPCTPHMVMLAKTSATSVLSFSNSQGLTLVHYSAQRKHVLWDKWVCGWS